MRPEFGVHGTRDLRILDFDIENRPLSYWYQDATTAEVTAIAWSWVGDSHVECDVLESWGGGEKMLANFRNAYDLADMVTGHYIRRHDLPILNGAMVEHGLGPLPEKLASDTKLDMQRWGQLPQTQEFLSDLLGTANAKYHMTQTKWRKANRLHEGIAETRKRVMDDVVQHKELRVALINAGLLKTPRIWRP